VIMPWTFLFACLFFYVVLVTGGTMVKDLYLKSLTIQQGRAAAIYQNGMDPQTGVEAGQELADEIQRVVPVDQVSVTQNSFPPSTDSVGMQELVVNVNYYDGSYVTTTMIYGAKLPFSSLLDRFGFHQTQPIPMSMQVSYYREW
jgi:hypothetical protein